MREKEHIRNRGLEGFPADETAIFIELFLSFSTLTPRGLETSKPISWAGIMPMSLPENSIPTPQTEGVVADTPDRRKRREGEDKEEDESEGNTYKIKRGDTLSEIALDVAKKMSKETGKKITKEEVMKAIKAKNGISNIHDIEAEKEIILPRNIEDIADASNTDISEKYENSKAGKRAAARARSIYEGNYAGITDSEGYYAGQRSFRQNTKLIPGSKGYDPEYAKKVKEELSNGYQESGIIKAIKGVARGIKNIFGKVDKGASIINYNISSAVIWTENTIIEGVSEISEAISTAYDWADEYIPMEAAMLYTGTSEFQAGVKGLSSFSTYTKESINSSRLVTSYKTSKVVKQLMNNGMNKNTAMDYLYRRAAQIEKEIPFENRRTLLGGRIFPDKDRINELFIDFFK